MSDRMIRDESRRVYATRDDALADGWDDAEFGWWIRPNETAGKEGWVGLRCDD